jgi:dephospho-CoA kinase
VTDPVWRDALLLRDWLSADPVSRTEYATVKRELAARAGTDVNDYSRDKMPWIWASLARAQEWAQSVAWNP